MTTARKPRSYRKAESLKLWATLPEDQKVNPCPIAYKHKGTTISEDGIRICGSEHFIKSVLSRLKDLLEYENGSTRLGVAFSEIQDMKTGLVIEDSFRCSVQVHERGREAQIVNRLCGIK